jgi:YD repeat-containing protein
MTTAEGKIITYTYDYLNRLTSLLDFYAKTTTYSYDSLGRRNAIQLANKITAS